MPLITDTELLNNKKNLPTLNSRKIFEDNV